MRYCRVLLGIMQGYIKVVLDLRGVYGVLGCWVQGFSAGFRVEIQDSGILAQDSGIFRVLESRGLDIWVRGWNLEIHVMQGSEYKQKGFKKEKTFAMLYFAV